MAAGSATLRGGGDSSEGKGMAAARPSLQGCPPFTSPSRPHWLPPLSPISPVPAPGASKHNPAGALASSAVPKQRPCLPSLLPLAVLSALPISLVTQFYTQKDTFLSGVAPALGDGC